MTIYRFLLCSVALLYLCTIHSNTLTTIIMSTFSGRSQILLWPNERKATVSDKFYLLGSIERKKEEKLKEDFVRLCIVNRW